MTTTITHKVRNPIYDKDHYPSSEQKRWLDIWSASVSSETYTITPSDNWVIPVTKIKNDGNTHNVTINTPITTPNTLAKINSSGDLVTGPIINSNGNNAKLLNEKGEWIEIGRSGPIILDTSTSKITIGHATSSDNWPSDTNLFYLKLNGDNYWPGWPESPASASSSQSSLIVNKYGHVEWANDIFIPLASSNFAGLVPKFTNNATDENKILKIVRNNNSNSITWVDSADLKNNIPVVTASANGLTPSYGSSANGKILSINSNNAPTWVDPVTTIPTVTVNKNGLIPGFSSADENKILKISKSGNTFTTSWVTPKVTLMSEPITHVDLNIDGNALSEEKPTVSAGRLSIPSIYWATDTKVEYQ